MPFTLAHPAAVLLPLRRFCPRSWLSFPALIGGSISPDVGYCFGTLNMDDFSHGLSGSIAFCLPVGIVLLGIFYGLRSPVINLLPERHRNCLLPLWRQPVGPALTVILSLLIGIWIHLVLDSFTHNSGWMVANLLTVLQTPIFSAVGHKHSEICNLLWYVCSFAGIVWLYLAWEQGRNCSPTGTGFIWRCQPWSMEQG